MKCKMLMNWKYGALYLEGNVYDFSNLSDSVPVPSNAVLEQAIEDAYMELARDGEPIAEANVVPALNAPPPLDTTPPPDTTTKGTKQGKVST